MDRNWIDGKIFWLTGIFNIDNSLFFSNFNSTGEIYKYFESSRTDDIRKAVDLISAKLGFIAPYIQYDWDGVIDDDKARGFIGDGKIVISMKNVGDKYSLASTTIHELMHYALMYRKGITLPDKNENEKITDLAAIVLGLGKIILNGKALTNQYLPNTTTILGTLTQKETVYAYKKICILRSINDPSYLNRNALKILNPEIIKNTSKPNYNLSHRDFLQAILALICFLTLVGLYVGWVLAEILLILFLLVILVIVAYKLFRKYFFLLRGYFTTKGKSKKKKCPFCKKFIPKTASTCPKCKKVLKESINNYF